MSVGPTFPRPLTVSSLLALCPSSFSLLYLPHFLSLYISSFIPVCLCQIPDCLCQHHSSLLRRPFNFFHFYLNPLTSLTSLSFFSFPTTDSPLHPAFPLFLYVNLPHIFFFHFFIMNRISRHNGNSTDMTVLERQQLQQQRKQSYLQHTHFSLSHFPLENPPMEENGWQGFVNYPLPRTGFDVEKMGFLSNEPANSNFSISRRSTCSPVVGFRDKLPLSVETEKKRKSDKNVGREEANGKKIKKEAEEIASKQTTTTTTNNNDHDREASADVSKVSEVQKQDFIHVRARRGQATDSHSLAERVRREKISERMRYLQDLVPGCNKIIGKAGMLDEIINYVQSLQRQVEFLSMKLATVTPQIDSNINDFVAKEIYQSCANSFPEIGMLPEVVNPPYYQFNPTCGGLDMEINHTEMSLGRTNSSPVSVPEEFLDSSCFPQTQLSIWENDLQSIYNIGLGCQDRSTAFLSEPFAGNQSASNLKMEI